MGLLDGLLGGGTVDLDALEGELEPLLVRGEEMDAAFKTGHDLFVFTNRRLIFVDNETPSGKRAEYRSIPYRSIRQFAVESVPHFDRTAELRLWLAGEVRPFEYELVKGTDVAELLQVLAEHVL